MECFDGGGVKSSLQALLMLFRLQLPDRDRVIQDGDRLVAVYIGCPMSDGLAPSCHLTHRLNIGFTSQQLKWLPLSSYRSGLRQEACRMK
jgi:hypothetical protein